MKDLNNFFSPESIAIIGASSKPGKIGHELVKNVSQYEFKGRIYPVNPKAGSILGLKCYPSITDVPETIDLAIYAAPSNILPNLVEEAGKKGVKNAIIVSGGFKEMGKTTAPYEEELVSVAYKYGMRLIGPNCIGVFDSESKLDTFFYPHERMKRPKAGGISFITQSGTFGLTFLEWATNSKLGIRRLVSLGNRCDVNEIDVIKYLGNDPLTKVIAVHLESVSDGRELIKAVKEVSNKKPIAVLKAVRTEEGSKAAKSHTGAITGSFQVCVSIFKQLGLIVAESFEELFDICKAIERQRSAKGKNVTIITNGAGPSVAAVDLCHELGLSLGNYSKETLNKLRSSLPPYAVIGRYVDLTGSATSEDYEKTFKIILEDSNIDAILNFVVFLNPPISPNVVDVILNMQKYGKPIVCWATGGDYAKKLIAKLEEGGIPTYPTSERTVKAAQALIKAGQKKKIESMIRIDVNRDTAFKILNKASSEGRDTLTEIESKEILRAYGIRTTSEYIANTAPEAINYASKIGFPVVLKVLSKDITHKSDVGGVITDIKNEKEVDEAFNNILKNVKQVKPDAKIDGIIVQNQISKGVEVIIGSTIDNDFGSIIAFGTGGIFVEIFGDLAYRLAPVSEKEALDMISNTKASKLLSGFRGQQPADLNKLAETITRTSFLAYELPIVEMDLNPIIVTSSECTVADARIRVKS
jgi:acetyl coenzyme A synthetase (ADP forming)-like protein